MEKNKILKLTDKELKIIKTSLIKDVLNYEIFKNKEDYEKELEKNYDKCSKLHKENVIKRKIITIIEYLER